MERAFEDIVHDRGTADPELLAGWGKDVRDPLLVPTWALLAGQTNDQVEVLGV